MRRFLIVLLALIVWSVPGCVSARTPQPATPSLEQKEKNKKNQPAPDEGDPAAQLKQIRRVLQDFSDGVEGRSPRRVMENLDEHFDDQPRFEDLVTQFFEKSSEMRVNFRESTREVKGDHATLIVDADMIFTLKNSPTRDQKRRQRIQFDFVRGSKGWKILEISPRQFFEP